MYVRLVRFSLLPGKSAAAQAIASELAPFISSQPGCKNVIVFGNDTDGESGLFVVWDSEANANAAAKVIRPKLDAHLAGNAQGAPDARLFKVLTK
jgi:quinol monooxygenase YgiN